MLNTTPTPKRRWLIPLIAGVLILILAIGLLLTFGLRDKMKPFRLLTEYLSQSELSMEMEVQIDQGGSPLVLNGTAHRRSLEGHTVLAAECAGMSLCFSDNNLYLESGKVYGLGNLANFSLPDSVTALHAAIEVSTREENGETLYILTLKEQAAERFAPEVTAAQLVLYTMDDALRAIRIDAETNTLSLLAYLTPIDPAESDFAIPEAAASAILSGKEPEQADLPADLLRLMTACSALMSRDPQETDLTLALDCGPLALEDQIILTTMQSDGQRITQIKRRDTTMYLSDGRLLTESGGVVSEGSRESAGTASLLPMALGLFLEGGYACEETNEGYCYSLSLGEETMRAITYALSPEAESLPITFQEGSITLLMDDAGLKALDITCGGSVQVLFLDVPMSLSCRMTFPAEADTFMIPEAVKAALKTPD